MYSYFWKKKHHNTFSINFAFVAKHQKSKQKLTTTLKLQYFRIGFLIEDIASSIIITDNKHMDKTICLQIEGD